MISKTEVLVVYRPAYDKYDLTYRDTSSYQLACDNYDLCDNYDRDTSSVPQLQSHRPRYK